MYQLKIIPHLSLQKAFDSTFHHQLDFNDLIQLDISQEYKKFQIQQKTIFAPSKKLKRYLRFLNSFIFDYAKVNTNVVHSYRRGVSAYTAVLKHANSKYFFQTDIENFFYSITTQDIEKVLETNLNYVPIDDIGAFKSQLLNLVAVDNALPVGFSTSPSISNTCLYAFDNELERICLKQGIIYTRYSDDIILSSKNNNLNDIQDSVSGILALFFNDRFQLNQNKTKRISKGKKIKLLGMVILPSGRVSVDMKIKNQIEILLHFFISDKEKFANYLQTKFHGDVSKISGLLNYINTIDQLYLNKLRKKYGNYVVDIFFHKSVEK